METNLLQFARNEIHWVSLFFLFDQRVNKQRLLIKAKLGVSEALENSWGAK